MLRSVRGFRGRSFPFGRTFLVAAAGGGGLRLRVAAAGAAPVGVAQGAQGGIEQQEGQKGGAGPLQQAVVLTSARGVEGGVGEHVDEAVELAAPKAALPRMMAAR